MIQFADLFKDCLSRFRETPEFGILSNYRVGAGNLSVQNRQAIINSVENTFAPLFDQIKADASSLTDSDLVFCVLCNMGIGAATIADCLTISPHTVRVRKHRLREKLPASWYDVFYGEGEHSLFDKPAKRMSFPNSISHCFRNYFNIKDRARRSEAIYYLLFATVVILTINSIDDRVTLFSCLAYNGDSLYKVFAIIIHVISWITVLGVLPPLYTVTVRRLHDLNCDTWPAVFLTGFPCAIVIVSRLFSTLYQDVFYLNKPVDDSFAFYVLYPIAFSHILLYIFFFAQLIVFSIKGK